MRWASTTDLQEEQRRLEAVLQEARSLSELASKLGELEVANNALLNQVLQRLGEIIDAIEELQNAVGITTQGRGTQKQTSSQLLELLTEINKKATPPPMWQIILFGVLGSVVGAFIFAVLVAIFIKLDILRPYFQR
jgi:hypothetical protein